MRLGSSVRGKPMNAKKAETARVRAEAAEVPDPSPAGRTNAIQAAPVMIRRRILPPQGFRRRSGRTRTRRPRRAARASASTASRRAATGSERALAAISSRESSSASIAPRPRGHLNASASSARSETGLGRHWRVSIPACCGERESVSSRRKGSPGGNMRQGGNGQAAAPRIFRAPAQHQMARSRRPTRIRSPRERRESNTPAARPMRGVNEISPPLFPLMRIGRRRTGRERPARMPGRKRARLPECERSERRSTLADGL